MTRARQYLTASTPTDFTRRLLRWFDDNRRDLPWRVAVGSPRSTLPPPYHVFISEAMLQQTQVATVIPYFKRFIEQFPSFESLAAAQEQAVLRAWQGLGYYSRARNLQKAARIVTTAYSGQLPRNVEELQKLPGVGRYTAGAIASLAFDQRAPILDGNVARVICRLEAIEDDPRQPSTREVLWTHATDILPRKRVGDFNSALMELGATVCTPRSPQCLICPVALHCEAFHQNIQDRIPLRRPKKETPLHRRFTIVFVDANQRVLIEQRPSRGRWAGLWQFITVDAIHSQTFQQLLSTQFNIKATRSNPLGIISHSLTHRRYEFDSHLVNVDDPTEMNLHIDERRQWVSFDQLDPFPLSKPQLAIAGLARKAVAG